MIQADSPIVVVTMADGSDDPTSILSLVLLVEKGVTIACASRYIVNGQQIGAPFVKGLLSKMAGRTFHLLTGIGTRDCTNNFKAYSKKFLDDVEISAGTGFEIGMELIAKAQRKGSLVAEVPTIWIERSYGKSNFKVMKQIRYYLKWFIYGIGIGKTKNFLIRE
jgi:dolichol-phosphate mannosyltransferase